MKKTRQKVAKTPKTTSLDQLPDEIREIFIAASKVYKIAPEILWQKRGKQEIVDARHSAIAIIYENYGKYIETRGYTLNRIGGFFNRDHTTVLHSINTADDLLSYDTQLQFDIKELKQRLHL
jgi:chromosomal replication initiation ATPase DnaA